MKIAESRLKVKNLIENKQEVTLPKNKPKASPFKVLCC